MSVSETLLARLDVRATAEMIVPIRDFVGAIAALQGFDADAVRRLELLAEEACLFVVENAFEPDEEGRYDLVLLRRPGKFVIVVEDKGLPFDFSRPPGTTDLGLILLHGFAEEIRFINLGKAGKRIEFSTRLPARPIGDYLTADERDHECAAPAAATDQTRLRMMAVEDAVALSRCIYRSYGYTYVDFIYQPERVEEMLRSGLMVSCVAENQAGEIVGHLALLFTSPDDKVAESGIAVVDPRYRGHNLFKDMKLFLAEEARRRGLFGIYSEAMTLHPFTQKGNIALGAQETGFMLGYVPPDIATKKIDPSQQGERAAVALYYLRTGAEPRRSIYAPSHHRAVIEDICRRIHLNRNFAGTGDAAGGETRLAVRVRPEMRMVILTVQSYGSDAAHQVRHCLMDLCRKKVDVIYLDLPLGDPGTASHCSAFESLGFFFAGVIPEFLNGDVLRLQYLNNLDINIDGVIAASASGRRLLDHVVGERKRILARQHALT